MKSKTIRTASVAALSLVLGISTSGYAAQEHPGDKPQEHAKPQQSAHGQAKPAQRQDAPAHQDRQQPRRTQSKPQAHAQPQQPREMHAPQPQREAKPAQQSMQQAQHLPEQQKVQQSAWQQHRASNWQSDHRTWAQRGGYSGYRIPDDRFHGHFGRSHGFRIGGLPFLVVGGYPRFQYQGYWFSIVDPYPESWANNWYDTDSVYVTYADNGYYLYDSRYPGVGIAISISM